MIKMSCFTQKGYRGTNIDIIGDKMGCFHTILTYCIYKYCFCTFKEFNSKV